MSRPMLRLFDGFANTSPELQDEVKELQTLLAQQGFSMNADGLFGRDTEDAVKAFQSRNNLNDDGVVGALTWAALLGTPPPDIEVVVPTTLSAADTSLQAQLQAAAPYRPFVENAARQFGIPLFVLAGLGSRESHWGLLLKPQGCAGCGDAVPRPPRGDRASPLPPDGMGYGRGLLQIDYDGHPFARGSDWKDAAQNILYGAKVLTDCRDLIARKTGVEGNDLMRAALAGYNCGAGNALKAIRDGRDIDFYTAHRDYSKDVMNRAGWFQMHGWS